MNLPPLDSFVPKRPGMIKICTVPMQLGVITRLHWVAGRLIAQTSSGVAFIVPPMVPPPVKR